VRTANRHLANFVPFPWDTFCGACNLPLAGTAMTTAETDFAYRIDRWDSYRGNIIQHIANMNDLELAMAAYEAACKVWPGKLITLRQGARIIRSTRVYLSA
jgi:hypothetical protein